MQATVRYQHAQQEQRLARARSVQQTHEIQTEIRRPNHIPISCGQIPEPSQVRDPPARSFHAGHALPESALRLEGVLRTDLVLPKTSVPAREDLQSTVTT